VVGRGHPVGPFVVGEHVLQHQVGQLYPYSRLMHFTEYDTRLAAYAVIVDSHDRILLTWYNGGGDRSAACWSMPGGGVEFDESMQQAVVREVLEETGYTVQVGGPVAVHHFIKPDTGRDGRPYKSVRVFFAAVVTSGSLGTLEVGGTTDFARWVPLDEVPSLSPRGDIVDVALTEVVRPSQAERPGEQRTGR
jgi:8-oxo-dGTP diphosphatase